MADIKIPLIINGRLIYGDDLFLSYIREKETKILLPNITDKHVETIRKSPRDLHELSVDDIISFYDQVGKLWSNESYKLRKKAQELTEIVTGYHKSMIDLSYDTCIESLKKEYLENYLDGEICNRNFLDNWITVKQSKVHARPRGRVLHILSGNVPSVSVRATFQGNLTKNSNILKIALGDPITATFFVMSFRDIDKDHPITKTTSVVYWEHGSKIKKNVFAISDAISVWGSFNELCSVRINSKPGQPVIEHGQRRSAQFIDAETLNNKSFLKEITDKAAYDIALYDQQACYSPWIAFVEKPANQFCISLRTSLEEIGKRLPKGYISLDERAKISDARNISTIMGDKIYRPGSTEWTVIITKDYNRTLIHPLSRTIYVIEVNDLKEAVQYIDQSIMVVGFSSRKRLDDLKDELTLRGVDRVTTVGKMGYFPLGIPQDGNYILSHLVRWVGKDISEEELTKLIKREKLPPKLILNRWIRMG